MTRIELVPEVLEDLDRIIDHLAQFGVEDATARIGELLDAIQILTHNPLIGRKVNDGKRELVIGRASRGYVALYRYVVDIDVAFVLALRSQRESAFGRRRL
jgi:plasmid stabilization system protein ParE